MKTAKELELLLLVKEKKIQDLTLELDHEKSIVADYGKRLIKAIEYISYKSVLSEKGLYLDLCDKQIEKILQILRGEYDE